MFSLVSSPRALARLAADQTWLLASPSTNSLSSRPSLKVTDEVIARNQEEYEGARTQLKGAAALCRIAHEKMEAKFKNKPRTRRQRLAKRQKSTLLKLAAGASPLSFALFRLPHPRR